MKKYTIIESYSKSGDELTYRAVEREKVPIQDLRNMVGTLEGSSAEEALAHFGWTIKDYVLSKATRVEE